MGRAYKKLNYFSPNDSNTIDDISGGKVKLSTVQRRWEGFMTGKDWHPRQPQDFPIVPVVQTVYKDARSEQVEAEGSVTGIDDDIV